ncbi:hypothetical protein HMPREF1870_02263 [Bacteroidales bacterium KA00344]|nr:hypothetical protein HMPREF1870_02263 [Bacteroidales bacterium KA00344]
MTRKYSSENGNHILQTLLYLRAEDSRKGLIKEKKHRFELARMSLSRHL